MYFYYIYLVIHLLLVSIMYLFLFFIIIKLLFSTWSCHGSKFFYVYVVKAYGGNE